MNAGKILDSAYSDAMLRHIARAESQYDDVCRELASEVLDDKDARRRK